MLRTVKEGAYNSLVAGLLRNYQFRPVYEASESNLIGDFYIPALMRATRYDRAVGYFRSSIFHLVQIALSDFVLRRGKMRLICSTSLDETDERVIRASTLTAENIDQTIADEIRASLRDPTTLPIVELLATMVKVGALDVRVAYKTDARGVFHTKVGIFHDDDGDAVSFDGSVNETFMAWTHNEERFKTFCTWTPGGREQVNNDQRYFNELWDGRRVSLLVRPLPDVARSILEQHANPDPQAALEKVRSLTRSRIRRLRHPPKQLQDHQVAVLATWREAKSGIIDHVTGGGKTITALACIREWFSSVPRASVLIVVPSDLLTVQWRDEIRSELVALDARILHAGGSRSDQRWSEHLREQLREMDSSRPRIVIATMDTGATSRFLDRAPVGDHTLMIVDEVHKVGAPSRRRILELNSGGRLGLSATPERFGDPEGTELIFGFFGEVLEPRFSIADALRSTPRRLVPYTYDFGTVSLEPLEASEYRRLTRSIAALAARVREEGDSNGREMLRRMRIKRARIVKGAHGKVEYAAQLLEEQFRDGHRWLVYCDTTSQLNSLAERLAALRISTTRYLSTMDSSKQDTLDRFERFGGVLLSIRCLDEGIDIPVVSHALILASSLNPREHIQRRGRVLRSAPQKVEAEIHDTLVGIEGDDGVRAFDHEVARARSFALDARNSRLILWRLDKLAREADPAWEDFEVDDTESREDD